MKCLGLFVILGATRVLASQPRGGLPFIFRGDSGDTGIVFPPPNLAEISPDSHLMAHSAGEPVRWSSTFVPGYKPVESSVIRAAGYKADKSPVILTGYTSWQNASHFSGWLFGTAAAGQAAGPLVGHCWVRGCDLQHGFSLGIDQVKLEAALGAVTGSDHTLLGGLEAMAWLVDWVALACLVACAVVSLTRASLRRLLMLCSLCWLPGVGAVTCIYCKGFSPGCTYDGTSVKTCPSTQALADNAVVIAGGASAVAVTAYSLSKILPTEYLRMFAGRSLQTVVSLCTRADPGELYQFDEATGCTGLDKIITRLNTGVLQMPQALARFALLIGAAEAAVGTAIGEEAKADAQAKADKLRDNMKLIASLKDVFGAGKDSAASLMGSGGVYTFIWGVITTWQQTRGYASKSVLDAAAPQEGTAGGHGTAGSSSGSAAASIHRPEDEWTFFEGLNLMLMILTSLGVVTTHVLTIFHDQIVFNTIRIRRRSWQFAHELYVICQQAIEDSSGQLHHGNVWLHTRFAALWEQAERSMQRFYPDASLELVHGTFRAGGGKPGIVDTKATWNGRCTSDAKRICPVYNSLDGKLKHTAGMLHPDGTCKFRHVCNQWVDNKGKDGRCLGNHARPQCTNAHKCANRVGV